MAVQKIFAVAAALLLSAGANASSSVTASLTDFATTVNQGSFNWSTTQESVEYLYTFASNGPSLVSDHFSISGLFTNGLTQTSSVGASATASASATGLSISLSTPAAGGAAYASATWQGYFDLAANSSVTFSWIANMSTSTTGGAGSGGYADVGLGSSGATAQAVITGFEPGYSFTYSQTGLGYTFWTANGTNYATVSTGDTALTGLAFYARAEGLTSDVAAVPEADSMAMVASGLAVFGLIAARRRRQA